MEDGYVSGAPVAPELEIGDPETFARVWRRVMPDQTLSPVELRTAGQTTAPAVPPTGGAAEGEGTWAAMLETLMALLRAGAWQCQGLGRRAGRGGGALTAMAREQEGGLRRLAACYFLHTGTHYLPRNVRPAPYTGMVEGLRQQYLQEGTLLALLAQGAAQGEGELSGLFQELAAAARTRRRRLQTMVEQRYPTP